MNEAYVECLVKAKGNTTFKILKYVLLALAVFALLTLLQFGFLSLLVCMAAGGGYYYVGQLADVEYEYLYLDKELTVDKVFAKTRRKRIAVFSLDKMEIVAPFKSYHLDSYKNRQTKVLDYSIGEECQPDLRYVFYYEGNQKVILSPSEEMIKMMKNVAPRKVFTD